jgi:hypothetical protein
MVSYHSHTKSPVAYGKSIKVGPPPNTQAFGNLPIVPVGWLGITPLVVGDTKTFVKSSQETFLISLVGVEVSSGTGC